MTTIYHCKSHDGAHLYTLCACGHQYCPEYWPACPRCAERAHSIHILADAAREAAAIKAEARAWAAALRDQTRTEMAALRADRAAQETRR